MMGRGVFCNPTILVPNPQVHIKTEYLVTSENSSLVPRVIIYLLYFYSTFVLSGTNGDPVFFQELLFGTAQPQNSFT